MKKKAWVLAFTTRLIERLDASSRIIAKECATADYDYKFDDPIECADAKFDALFGGEPPISPGGGHAS